MGTRALFAACCTLILATAGCSLRTSEAADLGPKREACTLGACRTCPCPGDLSLNGYQICNSKGEYIPKVGYIIPGCACAPEFPDPPPEICGDLVLTDGTAGSDGQ